jgi:hypothetical protein
MNKRRAVRSENLRLALAQEAARVMAEHGIRDFPGGQAQGRRALRGRRRRGAAQEYRDRGGTRPIPAAVRRRSPRRIAAHQRHAALRAMRCLSDFAPRLVGSVLSGTATAHCDVQLHLFADPAEAVMINLMDRSIPHEVTERRVKMSVERVLAYPAVRFTIDDQAIDATVFPADGIRQAPVSPVDGKPMRRANLGEVEALIEESAAL